MSEDRANHPSDTPLDLTEGGIVSTCVFCCANC